MRFTITGLSPEPFRPLFSLHDEELASRGIRRRVADTKPGYPCRVSLADAEIGEELLLLPFEHHPAASPFRAAGPIYVRREATASALFEAEIPILLRSRLLSARAYDAEGMMRGAEVVAGVALEPVIGRFFADAAVAYLHVHFAKPGCFACRVDRG